METIKRQRPVASKTHDQENDDNTNADTTNNHINYDSDTLLL